NGNHLRYENGQLVFLSTKEGDYKFEPLLNSWSYRRSNGGNVFVPFDGKVSADQKGNYTVELKSVERTTHKADGTLEHTDKSGIKTIYNKNNQPDRVEYPNGAVDTYQYKGQPPALDKITNSPGRFQVDKDEQGRPIRVWYPKGERREAT